MHTYAYIEASSKYEVKSKEEKKEKRVRPSNHTSMILSNFLPANIKAKLGIKHAERNKNGEKWKQGKELRKIEERKGIVEILKTKY